MVNETESGDIQGDNIQEESTTENERKKYEKEKKLLLKQIEELQQFVNEAELSLHSVKYGDIQIKNKTELLSSDFGIQTSFPLKTSNSNDNIEYELYKLAGLYCTKSTNNEFVFNVSASSNEDNSYAVQFFVEDDKFTLGHWVMPIGITMDYILAETPLKIPVHVIPFLRNCKRHVLCYALRKQQFDQLNTTFETITNGQITTNFGYLMVVIIFHQVTNKQTNKKINLTMNLFYNSGKVRPHTLKINSPSQELSSHLRNYTKKFKKDSLQNAYNSIINESHTIFEWKPEITTEQGSVLQNDNVTSESNNEDSEGDNNSNAKKRKRTRERTKKVEQTNVDSINSENHSDDSERIENEPVTEIIPKKKLVTRRVSKKLKATKEKASSKTILPEIPPPEDTENIPVQSNQDTNVKSSEPVNVVENPQKSRKEKQVKQSTKKKISAKSPEKETITSTPHTRSKQAQLNFSHSKVIEKPKIKNNSISNKKKTHTSTPMLGNLKKTKQLTLNLSPIVSTSTDTAKAKSTPTRKSPRKSPSKIK